MRKTLIYLLLCIFSPTTKAQSFIAYDANSLRETKWQYAYMLHLESNMVLHKADKGAYQYFLYFRFDQSYQQFLNGNYSMGSWQLSGNQLQYAFQGIENFKIDAFSAEELILEFDRPNQQGHFQ